jgi:phosphatidyl-myo-inositol alpha-mannosyltransferase
VRVGILCPYSLSRPGGVQGQALGLARALASLGHRAVVVAPLDPPRRSGHPPADQAAAAAEAFGLAPDAVVAVGRSLALPANGSRAPVSLSPAALVRSARAARRERFDVLHLHEPLAPGPGYAWLLEGGTPKVGTFHRAGSSAVYQALGPLARWAAGRLDVRCAVSPSAEATAAAALGGRYRIIPNGVDVERLVAARPWPTSGPTVLFAGRHEERKGLAVLLEAWELAGEALGPDAVLWVAGAGPLTESLRRRFGSPPRVAWLGRVDDVELAERLRGAHVLCAPSLGGESFGVVLVEAMAARCAVVASDLPGYAAVASDSARLVPPGDVKALAGALVAAVDDARRGSDRGSTTALDHAAARAATGSIQSVAEQYVAVYEELVATV